MITKEIPLENKARDKAWAAFIQRKDVFGLTRELLYRVEAGSARKPNKSSRVEQMQMAVQTLGPILSSLAGSGMVEPFNALMKDWATSLDIDANPYMLPPPPPPAPPGMPPGAPPPGGAPPGSEPPPEAQAPGA